MDNFPHHIPYESCTFHKSIIMDLFTVRSTARSRFYVFLAFKLHNFQLNSKDYYIKEQYLSLKN